MKLDKISTRAPKSVNEKKLREEATELILKMREYQKIMYAQNKYSLLIIFQGMDAAGKDNAIKKVFRGLNPLGCNAVAFEKPTTQEYDHDFLRRIHQHTPARGMVHIFNRSHYEDILVPTVKKLYPKETIEKRYDHINNFEKLLKDHDTIVIKFFLHISKEEQEEKIRERLVVEEKLWKFDPSDIESRQKWDEYQEVYEEIFDECNEEPRHIIPADQKRYKNYLVAKTIIEAFEKKMKLEWPDLDPGEDKYQELYTGKNKDNKLLTIKPNEEGQEKDQEDEKKKKKDK